MPKQWWTLGTTTQDVIRTATAPILEIKGVFYFEETISMEWAPIPEVCVMTQGLLLA